MSYTWFNTWQLLLGEQYRKIGSKLLRIWPSVAALEDPFSFSSAAILINICRSLLYNTSGCLLCPHWVRFKSLGRWLVWVVAHSLLQLVSWFIVVRRPVQFVCRYFLYRYIWGRYRTVPRNKGVVALQIFILIVPAATTIIGGSCLGATTIFAHH